LPITRSILETALERRASDAFQALHRLARLRADVAERLAAVDALVVPTAPTIFTVAAVQADPLRLNAQLGAYVNFVNLLDLAALAVPTAVRPDGLPFGVTLIGPWGSDARLGEIGARLHAASALPMGATGKPLPTPAASPAPAVSPAPGGIAL